MSIAPVKLNAATYNKKTELHRTLYEVLPWRKIIVLPHQEASPHKPELRMAVEIVFGFKGKEAADA